MVLHRFDFSLHELRLGTLFPPRHFWMASDFWSIWWRISRVHFSFVCQFRYVKSTLKLQLFAFAFEVGSRRLGRGNALRRGLLRLLLYSLAFGSGQCLCLRVNIRLFHAYGRWRFEKCFGNDVVLHVGDVLERHVLQALAALPARNILQHRRRLTLLDYAIDVSVQVMFEFGRQLRCESMHVVRKFVLDHCVREVSSELINIFKDYNH